MARIPTYSKDINISDLDRFIGTDGDTNELTTKNFYLGDVAEYVIDKFIDPDAQSFTIPVFRDTSDVLGANATKITGSIISQNSIQGTNISIAGSLDARGQVLVKGDGSSPGKLILSTENAQGVISIEAPTEQNIVQGGYKLVLPNSAGEDKQQLTTDGQGLLYWADAEDDDLIVRADDGEGKVDLDSQKLTVKGSNYIVTRIQDQTLEILGKGIIGGVGSAYNVPLFDSEDTLVNSLISQDFSGSQASKVRVAASSMVVGEIADAYQNQHVLGNNVDSVNDTIIDNNTTVALGDGAITNNRYKNVAVLSRGLRIGKKDTISNSSSNTTGFINFNDSQVGNQAFINYSGIVGYFPMILNGSNYAASHFFNAFSEDSSLGDFDTNDHNSSARYNLKFTDFGDDSNSSGKGAITLLDTHSNNSEGSVLYSVASQNYDYTSGSNNAPGSGGIFTFDARNNGGNNECVIGGTTLFTLKSGYSNEKFKIHQVQGGSSNPAPSLEFGKNASATHTGAIAMGVNVTASGKNSFSFGNSNTTSGAESVSFGFNNTVTGTRSGGLGANNIVAGGQVWATGDGNEVGIDKLDVGGNIIASGFNNDVKSGNSCVIGSGNVVTNPSEYQSINKNFVLGSSNTLNEVANSIAIGSNNTVNNNEGYILGKNNTTSASDVYAIGLNNSLNSAHDYAFGLNNTVDGNANIAMALGHNNTLSGSQSYVFGRSLKDGGLNDTVIIGRYNQTPTATGRIVFGTGYNDTNGRKNAIEIQAGSGSQSGLIFKALKISASYNSDADAASAGVETGELYRSNNQVKINTNQGTQDARNNEGFVFLTPRVKVISSGESFNYNSNYNLLKLGFSGNGNSAEVVLPGAGQDLQNRVLQCVTDDSFSGKSINFTVSGGGFINGATNKTITGIYKSIKFWSDGAEWFVLSEQ